MSGRQERGEGGAEGNESAEDDEGEERRVHSGWDADARFLPRVEEMGNVRS